jgi:hypothetical protein
MLGSERRRVAEQLKKMCLAGELDACVVDLDDRVNQIAKTVEPRRIEK